MDTIIVRASGIGDELYRITPSPGDGRPAVTRDGPEVAVTFQPPPSTAPHALLYVDLQQSVAWQLRITARTTSDLWLGLRGTLVRALDVKAAAKTTIVTLDEPHGSVPVDFSGTPRQLHFWLRSGTAASVHAGQAVESVSLQSVSQGRLGPGSDLDVGEARTSNRYEITLPSGAGELALWRTDTT